MTGDARRKLADLSTVRPRIKWLCDDTGKLLESRNFLVHALVAGHGIDRDAYVAAIYSARHDVVEYITAETVEHHARYFAENLARFREAISAELADQLTGEQPGYPPRPRYRPAKTPTGGS